MTKICTKCGIEKERTEYGVNAAAPDGLSWRCNICLREEKRAYYLAHRTEMNAKAALNYQANKAAINAWHRRWRNNEGRERNKKTHKEYTERSRDKKNDYNEQYRMLNPEKIKAHTQVLVACRNGTLIKQPCERCGKSGKSGKSGKTKVHAHHEAYDKPLEVTWLCSVCHSDRHKEIEHREQAIQ